MIARKLVVIDASGPQNAQTYTVKSCRFLSAPVQTEFAPPREHISDTGYKDGSHEASVPFQLMNGILGALFRSVQYQRNETELVVLVTPYLAGGGRNRRRAGGGIVCERLRDAGSQRAGRSRTPDEPASVDHPLPLFVKTAVSERQSMGPERCPARLIQGASVVHLEAISAGLRSQRPCTGSHDRAARRVVAHHA